MEVGVNGVGELLQKSEEVVSLCNAVLHYEALRTHTVDAITWDATFTSVSYAVLISLQLSFRICVILPCTFMALLTLISCLILIPSFI